jgi:protein-L-isoaspartate(D-aspartate) O-methyltransferase
MQDLPSFPWEKVWPEIRDANVRAAFAAVDRARFVDLDLRPLAVRDVPLPIGEGQTISQPFVVALMAQTLALQAGERVLEIGTGSGFETAILCELTAAPDQPLGATVFAVERLATLAQRAAATLHQLGYAPHLRVGDGAAGWPEAAPFAAIVVSAAASHVPMPLWEQLAEEGRMILPIGGEEWEQELWLVRKFEGVMQIKRMGGVRFVPLISPLLDDPRMWAEVA